MDVPENVNSGETSGGLRSQAFDAGPDHVIVVYEPPDTGEELDPTAVFAEIAADATARAEDGLRILSMVAVAVVYERWPGVAS